jgi:hypothetical protein
MPVPTDRFEQPLHRSEGHPGLSEPRRAQGERLALQLLTVLSMGSVLTALIALRAAICLWRFNA